MVGHGSTSRTSCPLWVKLFAYALVDNFSVCVGFVFCFIFACLFSLHENSEAKGLAWVHTETVVFQVTPQLSILLVNTKGVTKTRLSSLNDDSMSYSSLLYLAKVTQPIRITEPPIKCTHCWAFTSVSWVLTARVGHLLHPLTDQCRIFQKPRIVFQTIPRGSSRVV